MNSIPLIHLIIFSTYYCIEILEYRGHGGLLALLLADIGVFPFLGRVLCFISDNLICFVIML